MNKIVLTLCRPLLGMCLTLIFATFISAQQADDNSKSLAEQFVSSHELTLRQTTNLVEQFSLLMKLAPAAIAAGDNDKASNYAGEMVDLSNRLSLKYKNLPSSTPDNAAHISNIVLGRIAFDNGKIDEAKEHLLAAGKLTGKSPTLVSFGPDMSLAKLLLEKGEQETVLKYFDLCATFWKNDIALEKLAQWKSAVEKDETPDFGVNLQLRMNGWRSAR